MKPQFKYIAISIDRGRLRWFAVSIAVLAALVSFGVAIRAHNNTIAAKENLCTASKVFTLFLADEALLRSDEANINSIYQGRENKLVNATLQFWRGLSAAYSDAFLNSAIRLRGFETKYREDRFSADTKLVHKHIRYWNKLANKLHDQANCGKAVIG